MSMAEFVTRAIRDPDQSLSGVRVRLVGFVAPGEGAGGYRLTRFVVFCCAADAEALQTVVRGDPTLRARDQWLEVEGTWQPRPTAAEDDPSPPPPTLNVDMVRPIALAHPPTSIRSSSAADRSAYRATPTAGALLAPLLAPAVASR
jgi:uncharacterized membrane protein YcgQ (UPF0703/DUF1980 family)